MIGSLSIFTSVYDVVKNVFSEDPQTITNTIYNYTDGGIIHPPASGFKLGRIYYIQSVDVYFGVDSITTDANGKITNLKWTIYQDFGFDRGRCNSFWNY